MYLADPAVSEAAVGQRVEALSVLLDCYERDLPPSTCVRFLQGLRSITNALVTFHRENLSRVRANNEDDLTTRDEQIVFYSNIVLRVLVNIHEEYLPFLDSGTHQKEYSVLPSIQRVVALFEKDVEITLIPQFEYCYGFVGFHRFVSRVLDTLEKHLPRPFTNEWTQITTVAASPKMMAFLLYPVAEGTSALRLTVLAHELVHVVDHLELLYRQCLPLKLETESFNGLVDGWLESRVGTAHKAGADKPLTLGQIFPKAELEAKLFKECNSMVESWLRELIADTLAVQIVGPAYYFAFVEFLAHAAADNKSDREHDQPGFRLKLIFEELAHLGYFDVDNPLSTMLHESRSQLEEEKAENYDPKALVVHKTISQNLAGIQQKLRVFVGKSKAAFSVTKYNEEVPHIVARLMRGVSPAEWHDPGTSSVRTSSVVGILNAGWQVYKDSFGDFCSLFSAAVPTAERLVNLNELVFHAIESSEVVRLWNRMEVKDQR